MYPPRLTASVGALLLGASLSAHLLARQARPQPPSADPPVSMTCPMHPDVVESSPGNCPICKMALVPVRLESIWTCPVHAVIHESEPGACPICRRTLIQMTVAVTFTCDNHPEIDQLNRGTCPDGKPMVVKRTLRPHGNHNPQHGGQFFMAPDNTHHLEGAYPRARLFRLYVYDDYARPLAADRIKRVKARVVTREMFDSATRQTREISAFPLTLSRNGYFEAQVDTAALPAEMTAKVRFKDDGPEYRFDFTFAAISKDTTPPASTPVSTVRRDSTPQPSRPAAKPAAPSAPAAAPVEPPPVPAAAAAGQNTTPIPETTEGIVRELRAGSDQVRDLVQKGDFGAVWVPAFQARDLAIALEGRLDQLTPAKRETAGPAIRQIVRTAWLLDAFGDLGNRQQIADAYTIFAAAVEEAVTAFSPRP